MIKDDIITILNSQIGYKETGTNITKYSKYFDTSKKDGGAWQFFNTKKQSSEWCAILVLWAFCQIIGPDKTRAFLGLPAPANNCAAGCKFFYDYLKNKGYKVEKTKGAPGSIVFFNTKSAKCGHVGMIVDIKDGKYYTVEGNKSNQVKKCSYVINSSTIYAICTPDYETLEQTTPEPVTGPRVYIVKKGDTITEIAKRLNVSIYKIKKLNPQIKNINLIYPGNKIYY